MSTEPTLTEENIRKPIARFTNSFDPEDWAAMESALTEMLTMDHPDLPENTPAKILSSEHIPDRLD